MRRREFIALITRRCVEQRTCQRNGKSTLATGAGPQVRFKQIGTPLTLRPVSPGQVTRFHPCTVALVRRADRLHVCVRLKSWTLWWLRRRVFAPRGRSSVPRGSIAAASVVLGITTKTCLTQRLRCHQPPRDKTLSSDPYAQLGTDRSTARGGRFARDWLWSLLLDLCIH